MRRPFLCLLVYLVSAAAIAAAWMRIPALWVPFPMSWGMALSDAIGASGQEDVADLEIGLYFVMSLFVVVSLHGLWIYARGRVR